MHYKKVRICNHCIKTGDPVRGHGHGLVPKQNVDASTVADDHMRRSPSRHFHVTGKKAQQHHDSPIWIASAEARVAGFKRRAPQCGEWERESLNLLSSHSH